MLSRLEAEAARHPPNITDYNAKLACKPRGAAEAEPIVSVCCMDAVESCARLRQ